MTVQAKYLVRQCAETVQDLAYRRWAVAEWVRYLNDGRREMAVSRPDVFSTTVDLTLVDGARQTLPADVIKLIDLRRNASAGGRVVRQCAREILDAINPDWMSGSRVSQVAHFSYDPRVAREFYVYPPVAAGVVVEAVCAVMPVDIAEPSPPATHEDVVGNIEIPDPLAGALVSYMLYRAYAKDSESPSSAAKAQAYYTAFTSSLSTEVSATVTVGPTTRETPLSSS